MIFFGPKYPVGQKIQTREVANKIEAWLFVGNLKKSKSLKKISFLKLVCIIFFYNFFQKKLEYHSMFFCFWKKWSKMYLN